MLPFWFVLVLLAEMYSRSYCINEHSFKLEKLEGSE